MMACVCMCMVRFSFLKSRLIPGDETTMCNERCKRRDEARKEGGDGRSPVAGRTIAAPRSIADKQIAN